MKQDKKLIFDAFAHLFVLMIESDTDNIELTFNFNKCKARFKVDLVELVELEYKENIMSDGIYNYVYDVKERLAEKDKRIAELEIYKRQLEEELRDKNNQKGCRK